MIDLRTILIGYAGVTTLALSWFLVTAASPAATKFGEIDVQRINVREPDGTLRMTISNAATAPGIIVRGREYPHPSRKSAGMLFYNEEGTENGGLIFDGRQENGKRRSGGSLTFDQYEQDQVVQMIGEQDGDRKRAGIAISDRPDAPMDFAAITRAGTLPPDQRMAAYRAANIAQTSRLFVGRDVDGSSQLALRDGMGRKRLVMRVAEDGAATIDFLDPAGKVTRTVRGNRPMIVDAGIGFGKSLAENLTLINNLALFHGVGVPLMLAASRKRMIGALSNEAPVGKRLGGSLALALKGADAGVQLLRVHDVAETVQALKIWRGLKDQALVG